MLKKFWAKNRKLIAILLAIYLLITALLLIGSWGDQEMGFIYQIN